MSIALGIVALIVIIAVFFFLSKSKTDSTGGTENDAKRFARLLVSEIKLYNEAKVRRGLQDKNLADSLRDEIAEARGRYSKRITGAEMQSYFDDALIEILADGDRDKFGAGVKSSLR